MRYGSVHRFRGDKLRSKSKFPVAFIVDGTGSMRDWPGIILENIVELEDELEEYIPGFEMSITVVGDAYSDKNPMQPLQVCDFSRGRELKRFLSWFSTWRGRETIGGGGGQGKETYELAFLLYSPLYCEMPNAELPMMFVIGDENYYPRLTREHIRQLVGNRFPTAPDLLGVMRETLDTLKVMQQTKEYFDGNVWMFRKRYGRSDRFIHESWERALGEDKVALVERPEIVNDAMIEPLKGIVAKYRGFGQQYLEGLEERQGSEIATYVGNLLGIRIGSLPERTDLFDYVNSKFNEINRGGR